MNLLPDGISAEAVLCVLTLPGLTADQGLINVGRPKAGETLVVSGAVGSVVGQTGKAEGLVAIGIAETDEKYKWIVDEQGFDAAINYNSASIRAELGAAIPNGIDLSIHLKY